MGTRHGQPMVIDSPGVLAESVKDPWMAEGTRNRSVFRPEKLEEYRPQNEVGKGSLAFEKCNLVALPRWIGVRLH